MYFTVTFVFVPLVDLEIHAGTSGVLFLVTAHFHPKR